MSKIELTKTEVTSEQILSGYAKMISGRKEVNLPIAELFLSSNITKDSDMGTVEFTRLIRDMANNKLLTLTKRVHADDRMHVLDGGEKCNCILIKNEVARQVTERKEDVKMNREIQQKINAAKEKRSTLKTHTENIQTADEALKTCITQKQYAELVKKSPSTIGSWRKKGYVQSIKISRKVYIDMSGGFSLTYTGTDRATIEILRLHDASLELKKAAKISVSNTKIKEENNKLRKENEDLKVTINVLRANEEVFKSTVSSLNSDLVAARSANLTDTQVEDAAKIEALERDNAEHEVARKELSRIINVERAEKEELQDKIDNLVERLEEFGEDEDGNMYVSAGNPNPYPTNC